MSFCSRPTDDENDLRLRLPFSLCEWLQECRQGCDAERLRWFLGDFESFCRMNWGENMTATREQKQVKEFILANDDNLQAALSVVEAWPKLLERVVDRFLGALRQRIGEELASFEDLKTGSAYTKKHKNGVWISRGAWSGKAAAVPFVSLGQEGDAQGWFLGVGLDLGTGEAADDLKERLRERLSMQAQLRGSHTQEWPWYRALDECGDWRQLLVQLHRESEQSGCLTAWFSEQFVETAKLTIPVIDEVLGTAG